MIKIEVTGNSIAEVADKLLAIGNSLRGNAIATAIATAAPSRKAVKVNPVMPELAEAAKADVKPAVAEVAKAAPVDPTPATSAPTAEAPSSPPVTTQSSSDTTDAPAPSASEAAEIDFIADVVPTVVKVVSVCGKPAMAAILEHFGVAKASLLPVERLPELIAMMNEALAGVA